MMIPDSQRRLDEAIKKLSDLLVRRNIYKIIDNYTININNTINNNINVIG